jgi:hypothetical protein
MPMGQMRQQIMLAVVNGGIDSTILILKEDDNKQRPSLSSW